MDPHPFHTIHCFPIKRVQIDLSLFTTQRCVHAQRLADSKLCCTLAIKEAGSYISAVLTAVVSALGRKEPTYTHYIQYMLFSPVPTVSSLLLRKESAIVTFSAAVTVLCRRRRKQLKYDRTARQHHLASPQHSSRLPSKAIRKLNCFLQSLSQIACFRQCPHKIHFQSITQEYNLMI